jgi:BirA family biotin operon repressor/biotin-[acetyl-CoA-carboxylase] ligase
MRTRDYSIDRAILAALEERRGYVSGEDLSGRFGLSRAAIWKHIQALRDDGYEIKAKRHRGYVLVQRPDRLSSHEIRRNLRTAGLIGDICTFEEVTSTNDKAYEMALHGAQEGVVVIAESQTQGRGRMNRAWFSPHGKNLYLSVILRPSIPPRLVPVLTYLGAISTAGVFSEAFSLDVELKWPNDVLRFEEGKKDCRTSQRAESGD